MNSEKGLINIFNNNKLKPFLDNTKYVYMSCKIKWIIVFEKDNKTMNDESCYDDYEGSNHIFAKFKTNRLKCVCIFNKFKKNKIIKKITDHKTSYQIDRIISKQIHYDEDKHIVKGISYFKSIIPAYYYDLDKLPNYTGYFVEFYYHGLVASNGNIQNGKIDGLWSYYNDVTGLKEYDYYWIMNKCNSFGCKITEYCPDGSIKNISSFV